MVLGVRTPDGEFVTNSGPDTVLAAGSTLIAIGTDAQLAALAERAGCSPASESNR
jgi:K+/H+ antiporter YhaU regulatory subunit KhtT